ncbi:MAG: D-alanyl-D-alanine carboxypeptidase family protein, partial [Eubacterium sp.]|nr:D-alanyl-D-alanine carboxypeptidase family protein [Eubacterium sp.]
MAERREPERRGGAFYVGDVLIVNKSYPLDPSFGDGLTPETQAAFEALRDDAAKLGLTLENNSGFRPYDYQHKIYWEYVAE